MRRFTKSALVVLGAAAATFAVVSQMSGSPVTTTPAAKTKLAVCQPDPESNAIVTVPTFINISVPTLPNITLPTLPCIPLPQLTVPSLPNVTIPPVTLPTVTLPTVTLPTIPDISIPIPRFRTTTTGCNTDLAAVKAGATIC